MADSPTYGPYAWRSARSRNGTNSTVDEMAARGRAPSIGYDRQGQPFIRGFRSRPGAPHSPRDTMNSAGVRGDIGSEDRASSWNRFFENSRNATREAGGVYAGDGAPAQPSPVTADPNDDTGDMWSSDAPISDSAYLNNSIQGNRAWMGRSSVSAAPPLSPPDRSMPSAPFMPRSPSEPFVVPTPLPYYDAAGNYNSDNAAANLDSNRSMAAPGGASGLWRGRTRSAPSTTTRTPETAYGTAGSTIRSKYGFATNVRPFYQTDVSESRLPRLSQI